MSSTLKKRNLHGLKTMSLGDGKYLIENIDRRESFLESPLKTSIKDEGNGIEYVQWGKNNKLPVIIRDLTIKNHIAPSLLNFKIRLTMGHGVVTYKYENKDTKQNKIPVSVPEIDDFLEANDYEKTMFESCTDLHWWGFFHQQMIRAAFGGKIIQVKHHDSMYVRCAPRNSSGEIPAYLVGNFYDSQKELSKISANINDNTFIVRPCKPSPGHFYYPPATWHSSEHWMRVSNEIPLFKIHGMENAISLRYIIEVDWDLFMKEHEEYLAQANENDPNDNKAARTVKKQEELLQKIQDFLTGSANAYKNLQTWFYIDEFGKEHKQVKITVLKDETNYAAYKDDNNMATSAICTAHNVPPNLANVIIENKLNSGSENLYSYNIQQALHAYEYQQYMLKPLYLIKKINGWDPDIHFGIRTAKLEPLEANPTGGQKVF